MVAFADTLFKADFKLDKNHDGIIWVNKIDDPSAFGVVKINEEKVITDFVEKPPGDGGFINGGYFVLEPECLEIIGGDDDSWESGPLNKLAGSGNLMAFEHEGFWQPMDTLREKNLLEEMWTSGSAPWKIW